MHAASRALGRDLTPPNNTGTDNDGPNLLFYSEMEQVAPLEDDPTYWQTQDQYTPFLLPIHSLTEATPTLDRAAVIDLYSGSPLAAWPDWMRSAGLSGGVIALSEGLEALQARSPQGREGQTGCRGWAAQGAGEA